MTSKYLIKTFISFLLISLAFMGITFCENELTHNDRMFNQDSILKFNKYPDSSQNYDKFNITYQNFVYAKFSSSSLTNIHFDFASNDPHVRITVLMFDSVNFNNFIQKKTPCIYTTIISDSNATYAAAGVSTILPQLPNSVCFFVYYYNSSSFKIPIELTVSTSIEEDDNSEQCDHALFKGNEYVSSPAKLFFNDWVVYSNIADEKTCFSWNLTLNKENHLKIIALDQDNYLNFLKGKYFESQILFGDSDVKISEANGNYIPLYNDTWYILIQNQDTDNSDAIIHFQINLESVKSNFFQDIYTIIFSLIIGVFLTLLIVYLTKPTFKKTFRTKNRIIMNIFSKFYIISKKLEERHDNRHTLKINDEYDVQDLLHSLLCEHFESIRAEDYGERFAGKRSPRVDFYLAFDNIAIEVKYIRNESHAKKLHEEIIIDKDYYSKNQEYKHLYFFIFDPNSFLTNRPEFITDLKKNSPENYSSMNVVIKPDL